MPGDTGRQQAATLSWNQSKRTIRKSFSSKIYQWALSVLSYFFPCLFLFISFTTSLVAFPFSHTNYIPLPSSCHPFTSSISQIFSSLPSYKLTFALPPRSWTILYLVFLHPSVLTSLHSSPLCSFLSLSPFIFHVLHSFIIHHIFVSYSFLSRLFSSLLPSLPPAVPHPEHPVDWSDPSCLTDYRPSNSSLQRRSRETKKNKNSILITRKRRRFLATITQTMVISWQWWQELLCIPGIRHTREGESLTAAG